MIKLYVQQEDLFFSCLGFSGAANSRWNPDSSRVFSEGKNAHPTRFQIQYWRHTFSEFEGGNPATERLEGGRVFPTRVRSHLETTLIINFGRCDDGVSPEKPKHRRLYLKLRDKSVCVCVSRLGFLTSRNWSARI